MRKIQTGYTKAPAHALVAIGDSHTLSTDIGVTPDGYHPHQTALKLNAQGASVKARNFGRSGDSTCMALGRIKQIGNFEVPSIGVIYLGTNDSNTGKFGTVQASPAPTTTTFNVTAGVGQTMPAGTWIIVGGTSVQITAQVGDALTVSPPLPSAPAAGASVAPDTQTNLVAIGNYFKSLGCQKLVVCGHHYLNFSTGGDTVASPLTANATLRTKQQAAATTLGAAYCDFFAGMAARITNGTDTQGSFSWHIYDGNSHLNSYGEGILASLIYATITAQSGWLAALS